MDRIVDDDASLAASSLSDYLAGRPDEMERLRQRRGLSDTALRFVRAEGAAEHIVSMTLFGADGHPVFGMRMPPLLVNDAKVYKPALVTSAVPVRVADHNEGWLEVISDQGPRRAHLDDELFWALVALAFLTTCSFGVPAFVFLHETAQRELSEERMTFLASHDAMTGLLNRSTFNKAVDQQLAGRGSDEFVAFHLIDVDRFKSVNDSLGHNVGDEVIKAVGARIQTLLGPDDFAARFGGDEFVMAQVGVREEAQASARAVELRHAIQEPFQAGEHQIRVTASVGISLAPRDGASSTELAKTADVALYNAKADGRDSCRMYDPSMDAALLMRRKIEKALLHAFATETFELHFQPIVVASGEKLLGFEVLLRLNTEDGEALGPTEFIPVAEEMGLISNIGAWVIRKSCISATNWPDHLMVAVNLSPRQFENGELCDIVKAALKDSGLAPSRLELEITEGLLVSDTEGVMAQLRELKAIGVSIAMDDFGTGYSSLSYLWQFPFDKLKIDRSFMRVLAEGDEQVSSILNTIISLGRTLNLEVTAEGVETAEQAAILQKLNCNQLQGYYFGHPTPEHDVAGTILKDKKAEMDAAAAKKAKSGLVAIAS
jgi:diguanylate cyclase (GGDEF)-like protein